MLAGILFSALLPKKRANGVSAWIAENRRAKHQSRFANDAIANRVEDLLSDHCTEAEVRACVGHYHDWRFEDFWTRLQAMRNSDRHIRTEVIGLEHVNAALGQGQGVVFWGMSFCGTLFSKIALSRVGVELTQLSAADHGAWFPLTLLGKRVVGPLHCYPENKYISERIRIPIDGNNSYLYRLGNVLKQNGCLWIAGERTRAKKLVSADVLGREGRFPVGAPTLALRKNACLIPAHTERLGRFHYRVTIESPILLDRDLSRNETVNDAVQEYARRLSARLPRNPGDFEWDHEWVRDFVSNHHES